MKHITTQTSSTDILCMFTILSAALAGITLVIVHFLPTGVNPISDAVSDYGAGDYKNFYRLAAFWLGASGLLLSITFGKAVFPKPTLAILALLVFAAVRWSITLFPTDLPGEEETSVGRAHFTLAAIAFMAIAIAAISFAATVKDDPLWHTHQTLLDVTAYAVVIAAIGTGITRRVVGRNYFGLVERLLYALMITWLISVAAILLTG